MTKHNQLVGYAWLAEKYGLRAPGPARPAALFPGRRKVDGDDELLIPAQNAPDPTLVGQLTFALKWEGVDLGVLYSLFNVVPVADIEGFVRDEPNGKYTRRTWFLFEWLTGNTLDLPDMDPKRSMVTALDTNLQYALLNGEASARHRVINNLPGTPTFCPLVRVSQPIASAQARDLSARAHKFVQRTRQDVLTRAAAFLELSDSKASFAIEREHPSRDRALRWASAARNAGTRELSTEYLVDLQRLVIGDDRFVKLGLRDEGGFVGEHDRDTRQPIPEHISARADDLALLMAGMEAYDLRTRRNGYDAVVAAASLAFGFVYVHPFQDGNGRLHRWLIHHALAARKFTPPGIVFPVSAAMLRNLDAYKRTLRSYSEKVLPLVEWSTSSQMNVDVHNATSGFYRFFDATRHAEFLYACVTETVEHDLPNEVAYLESYDRFVNELNAIVDMPASSAELLHRFLRQNGGRLSQRARDKEFSALTPDEVASVERLYATTTGSVTVSLGTTPEVTVAIGEDLNVDVMVSRPDATGADVASISAEISWDPSLLALKEYQSGDWTPANIVVNPTQEGRFRIVGFAATGTTKPFTLQRLTLTARAEGVAVVDVLVTAAGTTTGNSVATRVRNLRVAIRP
jgi:hypothetical protein